MWSLWLVVYFILALVGHAVVCRLPIAGNIVTNFLAVGGLVGSVFGVHTILSYGFGPETWTAIILYAFGCELYIFLFTMVMSSVSASLLIALRAGRLGVADIDRMYSDVYMVDSRIKQLLVNGFLSSSPSGYVLTGKGRIVVAMFRALRRFFRHATDGGPLDHVALRPNL